MVMSKMFWLGHTSADNDTASATLRVPGSTRARCLPRTRLPLVQGSTYSLHGLLTCRFALPGLMVHSPNDSWLLTQSGRKRIWLIHSSASVVCQIKSKSSAADAAGRDCGIINNPALVSEV